MVYKTPFPVSTVLVLCSVLRAMTNRYLCNKPVSTWACTPALPVKQMNFTHTKEVRIVSKRKYDWRKTGHTSHHAPEEMTPLACTSQESSVVYKQSASKRPPTVAG